MLTSVKCHKRFKNKLLSKLLSMSRKLTDEYRQQSAPSAARLAVAGVFFVNGAVFANWVTRIPVIQQKLGLSNGALGVAILGMAVGALVSMPTMGWVLTRLESRSAIRITGLCYCATLPLLPLAPNLLTLVMTLVMFGAFNGAMDVAMNAQGVAVEQRYQRPIMSSFHGWFSVGGMVGASGSGVLASVGVDPIPHLLGAALLLGIVTIFASRRLLSTDIDTVSHEPAFAVPTRSLLSLGVVSFCVLLGEGAMADWSAVYLRRTLGTGLGLAAAGYSVFSLAMAVCRFTGDSLSQRLGPVKMVRFGGIVAATGLGLSLIIAQPFVAFIGFACAGAGFSTIVPIVLSAAGHTPGMPAGLSIAAVTTTGYFGFLSGPPLIGFVGDLLSLRSALGIVVILSATIAMLARSVHRAAGDQKHKID
jgi:predicted MFS family arabinose efflux permease